LIFKFVLLSEFAIRSTEAAIYILKIFTHRLMLLLSFCVTVMTNI